MPCHHLSYESVLYANANKIPIIIDIRDLWPDIFLSHLKHPIAKKVGTTALTLDLSRLRYLLKNADALVAVSAGYLDWALERAGRSAHQWDRVFFLGYQPNKEDVVSQNSQFSEWLKNIANKKLLIFIGTFGLSYDLKLLLQAAKHMKLSVKDDIFFVIAGTGEQEIILNREALNLSNVILPGWIDRQDINALLKCGTVGILPYISDASQGIPNKCFEYLSAGLPLISSLEGEMGDLVQKYKVGLNYKSGDLKSLCNAIKKLLDDNTLWQELSKNALAFFDKYGDAEKIYNNYALHIETLALLKK
jgi:glycosyltransferase involved in cell wall biosynthesis